MEFHGAETDDSTASSVKLVAVVNSFNRRDLLALSLPSLVAGLKDLPFPTAIVVYEAGSTDGSKEWLRGFKSNSTSVEVFVVGPAPGEDSSFAAGVNAGCREAILRYPEVEYLFLFETDNLISG